MRQHSKDESRSSVFDEVRRVDEVHARLQRPILVAFRLEDVVGVEELVVDALEIIEPLPLHRRLVGIGGLARGWSLLRGLLEDAIGGAGFGLILLRAGDIADLVQARGRIWLWRIGLVIFVDHFDLLILGSFIDVADELFLFVSPSFVDQLLQLRRFEQAPQYVRVILVHLPLVRAEVLGGDSVPSRDEGRDAGEHGHECLDFLLWLGRIWRQREGHVVHQRPLEQNLVMLRCTVLEPRRCLRLILLRSHRLIFINDSL